MSNIVVWEFILVPFGGPSTLRLLRYRQPKSENHHFGKTQNGHQRFGLASKYFGQNQNLQIFVEAYKRWGH